MVVGNKESNKIIITGKNHTVIDAKILLSAHKQHNMGLDLTRGLTRLKDSCYMTYYNTH